MRARLALDAEDRPVEDHADLASASASTVSSSSHKFGAALASGPKIVPALGSTKAALKGVLVRKRGTEAKETKAPAVTKKLKGSAADKSRSPSPEKKNEIALVSGKASTASAVKAIAPASAIALVADYGSSDDDSA